MNYADQIREFKALPFSKYAEVSSREKLVVYSMHYLAQRQIPLSFNNICVATFKLFPEKFYFSEEFKEFPHIEMLNRTILHLRPAERNFATGSVRLNYELTAAGREVAAQVQADIDGADASREVVNTKVMDEHKQTSENDFLRIRGSEIFQKWATDGSIDEMAAWGYFDVTPFTQADRIQRQIKDMVGYANSKSDDELVRFLNKLKTLIV